MKSVPDAGRGPFIKLLGGKCRTPLRGQPPPRGTQLRCPQSRLHQGRLAQAQTQRAAFPPQRACSPARRSRPAAAAAAAATAEEVAALHSTPVAASRRGTASSGRSADFGASTHQSTRIMGLPRGPEGQGLPEVRSPSS